MKYCEYFEIDKNYYPVINPDSIKNESLKWQDTFPHETFISLLETTEKMLARENGNYKRSLWIEGSYGTGKSRVVWALQNLLSCTDEELDEYFNEYDQLRVKTDLKNKLAAHKHKGNGIITASRYESGQINTPERLINAVYESVQIALKKAGLNYLGEKTLRGSIIKWLEDSTNKKYFADIIQKPEYQAKSGIGNNKIDTIIQRLNDDSSPEDFLVESIMEIAEKQGITAFKFDIENLKKWLTDVIKTNNLKAIVFFWDEFSDYFKNNRSSLGTFQSLLELSGYEPFYMAIVTHMGTSDSNDQSFRLLRDRSIVKTIEMPDNIAFQLIGHAMKIKDAAKAEYSRLTEELNSYVSEPRKKVCAQAKIPEKTLRDVFPIHPMAALLLKHIAVSFASNQRSMFNFIKHDDGDNLHAFQWFINNKSPDEYHILTIDYLWNFFYEKGTDLHTTQIGRDNLDSIISMILGTYDNNEHKLNNVDEKRVLKALLLMQAISRKINNGIELLRPTKENLSLAFAGDESLGIIGKAINIADRLTERKILYIDSSSKGEEYAAGAVAGDQAQIDRLKEKYLDDKTSRIIQESELENVGQAFLMPTSIRMRYSFKSAAKDNFEKQCAAIATESQKSYQIKALFCFAKNEQEQNEIRNKIQAKLKEGRYKDIVFIDASSTALGNDKFDEYADYCAQEEYWQKKDGRQATNKKNEKKQLLDKWKEDINSGKFEVFYLGERTSIQGLEQLKSKLHEITRLKFPWSFDHIAVAETLYIGSYFKDGATYAIEGKAGGRFGQKDIDKLLGGVQGLENYWEKDKGNPISKIKAEIKKIADASLEGNPFRISILEIFKRLQGKGFMPCNLYAYLTGFLLKEYSTSQYRYSKGAKGDDGGIMTSEILGQSIGECIRYCLNPIRNFNETYIAKMTREQQAFADFAKEAFGIIEHSSVERIVPELNRKMQGMLCPIWCFKYADSDNLGFFIEKLAEISNPKIGNVAGIAGEIGKALLENPQATGHLKKLFTPQKGYESLLNYIHIFDSGSLLAAAQEAGIGENELVNAAKEKTTRGAAAWLWDKDTADEQLKNLCVEYKIISASSVYDINAKSFDECLKRWNEFIRFKGKMPISMLRTHIKELSDFLACIKHSSESYELPPEKQVIFLKEIEDKKTEILSLERQIKTILKKEYSNYLAELNADDINELYSKLDGNSFTIDIGQYEAKIREISESIKKEKAYYRLLQKWQELTGTENVSSWCEKYRTPIKAMISPDTDKEEKELAFRLFETIRSKADSKTAADMLDYLSKKPSFIQDLNNEEKIETAFKTVMLKKYDTVLKDNNEVRNFLQKNIGTDYYSWYGNPDADDVIEKLARQKYFASDGKNALEQKIGGMTAEEAKKYLIDLVKNNFDIGISILRGE